MLNLVENIRKIAFAHTKEFTQRFLSLSLPLPRALSLALSFTLLCLSILSLTLNCIERNHSFASASFIGFEMTTPRTLAPSLLLVGYFCIVDSIDDVSTLRAPIHVTKPIWLSLSEQKYYYDFGTHDK